MDDARFESLVRAVASRRSVSAGLLAALAAGFGSGALPGRSRSATVRAQDCGIEGAPCVEGGCCDGLSCVDGACVVGGAPDEVICANEGELCAKRPCCGDLSCDEAAGAICVAGQAGPVCGGAGEACIGGVCCEGSVCGDDGICYLLAEQPACAAAGSPCFDGVCCDGSVCGGDGICYLLVEQPACASEGEACDPGCCDGLTCSDAGVCESAVYCAFEGEYCRYLDCCEGLACSEDFACVPSSQAGGGGGNRDNNDEAGGDAGGGDNAPRPARTPRPSRTPEAGAQDEATAPQPAPQNTRPNTSGQGTPRPEQPARPARQNTFKGEPVFSTAVPADSLPDADAYALLAQVATIEPGITVDFAQEGLAGYAGLAVDYVIDGAEQIVGNGELQVYRKNTPGAAELVDAGQSATLNPGDAVVRKIEAGWKVSNTGTAPLRILHVIINENGAPTPPPGWNWSEFDFGSPVIEGPLGIMNLAIQRGNVEPGASVGTADRGSSQAVVQDLAARGARVSPLVPEPDGFKRNASTRPSTVYTVTLSPANG